MSTTFYYFAYGSNMLPSRLQNRCRSAKAIEVVYIEDYRLTFGKKSIDGSGKATLESSPGSKQYGVLFGIDYEDSKSLDEFEGYKPDSKTGYDRITDLVVFSENKERIYPYVMTYIDRRPTSGMKPYSWYLALIIEGARENSLPPELIKQFEAVESIPDPDPKREARNAAEDLLWERGLTVPEALIRGNGQVIINADRIFDGLNWHSESALIIDNGVIVSIVPSSYIGNLPQAKKYVAKGGFLAPGLVDLRVFADSAFTPSQNQPVSTITRICRLQARQGTTSTMLALKSSSKEVTSVAMQSVFEAQKRGLLGLLGLHLVGPYLCKEYSRGHAQEYIRDMSEDDLHGLISSEQRPYPLLLTLAPEATRPGFILELCAAGIKVGLGNTCAALDTIYIAIEQGASFVTSLFRNSSPIDGINPGLGGFALAKRAFPAGIQIHAIYPELAEVAYHAKAGYLFLTSDAGENSEGPDALASSLLYNVSRSITVIEVLRMACSIPAALAGTTDVGELTPGKLANVVHFTDEFNVQATWIRGMSM